LRFLLVFYTTKYDRVKWTDASLKLAIVLRNMFITQQSVQQCLFNLLEINSDGHKGL